MTLPAAKSVIVTAAISSVLLGFVAWRVRAHDREKVTNRVILVDNSKSTAGGAESLLGLVEAALNPPHGSRHATLVVMTLGDARTNDEPRIVATYELPFSRRALEGTRAIARKRATIAEDIMHRLASLPRADRSPIFFAISRAAEQLRGSGCRNDSECFLDVRTDAQETSERAIRTALQSSGKPNGLPSPVHNEGIQVRFCGLAETNTVAGSDTIARNVHNPARSERVREVWAALFTVPALVRFEPYCPTAQMEVVAR